MEDIFQRNQYLVYTDMEHYEQEKLLQEQQTQEHFMRMDLSSDQLLERYQPKQISWEEKKTEALQDMPQQSADEKESKVKKRKKHKLQSGAEELQKTYRVEKREQRYKERIAKRGREMVPNAQAQEIFEEPILAEQLTPEYVMNHFAQVRKRLDDWKEHMEVYAEQYAARHGLSRERELRMQQMEKLYQDSEKAFQTAIRALGYRYDPKAKAGRWFQDDLTEKEKAEALKENRLLRSDIKQAADTMTANVADTLLREEKGRRHDTFAKSKKRTNKLNEINELLLENQDKYAENKESVGLLCQELDRLLALLENIERDGSDIDSIIKERIDYEGKTSAYLKERQEELQNKERILRDRAECIEKGLKHVLTESGLTQTEMVRLRDFLPAEFAQRTKAAEDRAAYYAQAYREKERIQKRQEKDQKEQTKEEIAKEELAKASKPLVLPQMERLWAFDTKELEGCTDEELLSYNEELQDLYFSSIQISDMGKYRDTDDNEGRSIKDAFCGEKKEEFDLKCAVIQSYAMKARGIAMVKAYEQGRLTEGCFTKSELAGMHARFHVGEKAPLTMDHMLIAAKEMLEKASVLQEASYNRYFRSEHGVARYLKRPDLDTKEIHPAYKNALDDMKKAGREALGLSENVVMDSYETLQYHKYCLKQKSELEQKLARLNAEENGGEAGEIEEAEKKREIREQIAALQEHMKLLQTEYALRQREYQRAGDTDSLLTEQIFRGYDSVESLPAFQNMSDEAFRQMCIQLSAGSLEQDADRPERIEHYYRENMQGLQTYKQHLAEHYEMLEERFHHKLPSAEYIIEHKEELERLFADVQVNNHMVENMPDLFDLTKPEDLRIYHLVHVYNSMAGYICGIGTAVSSNSTDYCKAADMLTEPMRKGKSSFDYLDGKWDAESEKIHLPVLEKFRQLGADTARILTADKAEQFLYFNRVKELQDYIREHAEDTSTMAMKQMKGWLKLAQMRIQLLAKGQYHAVCQETDRIHALDTEYTLTKALGADDQDTVLETALEIKKLDMIFQSTLISKDMLRKEERKNTWQLCKKLEQEKGIQRLSAMPSEFQEGFVTAYYQKQKKIVERIEAEIFKLAAQLPKELNAEEREQAALYMVYHTELGREYEALKLTAEAYFADPKLSAKAEELKDRDEESKALAERVRTLEERLAKAQDACDARFKAIGYTQETENELLLRFSGEIVNKKQEAQGFNPNADADSYDMLYAQKKAKNLIAADSFSELAEKLSLLHLTKEMLTPEYMTFHAEELLASFAAMDAYQAMLKQTPSLEETVPAAQRAAWTKSRNLYERYREYVTAFMRSRCVDVQNGEYLTKETYLAEKEMLQGKLTKEKNYFEDMLGGFAGYAQQLSLLSAKVARLPKIKKDKKKGITKPLAEAETWLKDLTAYLEKPLVLEPEDAFDATVMTLMSMFGYIERDLRAAMSAMAETGNANIQEMSAGITNILNNFHTLRAHIPGSAQQLRKAVLQTGAAPELTLQDIVLNTEGVKTFSASGREENVGAAASDVRKLEEGEKVFFFKEDETLQNFEEAAKEVVPVLEEEELEKRILALLEAAKTDKLAKENLQVFVMGVKMFGPEGELKERSLKMASDMLEWDMEKMRGYIEKAENQEKWKAFMQACQKRYTVEQIITDAGYQLDEGADMTARNFASERVAELFGLGDLITKNHEAVIVEKDGTQRKGFAMELAEGVSIGTLRELASDMNYMIIVPGEVQRELLNLQILDNITGQVDRHTGNVFVSYHMDDEKRQIILDKVTGIDNDFAFGASEEIGAYNTDSVLVKKERVPAESNAEPIIKYSYLLGAVDKDMYEHLRAVKPELLAVNLEGIIEPPYIEALIKRYETVRNSIFAAAAANPDIVKEKDDWGDETREQLMKQGETLVMIKRLLK